MMMMIMMIMMIIMIMTIESVEQRPGWGEHVKTQSNQYKSQNPMTDA